MFRDRETNVNTMQFNHHSYTTAILAYDKSRGQSSPFVEDQRISTGSERPGNDPFVPSIPLVQRTTTVNLYLSSSSVYTQDPADRFRYSSNIEEERLRVGRRRKG